MMVDGRYAKQFSATTNYESENIETQLKQKITKQADFITLTIGQKGFNGRLIL